MWDVLGAGLPHSFGPKWTGGGEYFLDGQGDVEVLASGERLLLWGRESFALVAVADGSSAYRLTGHAAALISAAVFLGSDRLATGSYDKAAIIWNASTGEALHQLRHWDWVTGLALLAGEGRLATVMRYNFVQIWSTSTGERIRALVQVDQAMARIHTIVAFPHDDRLAAVSSHEAGNVRAQEPRLGRPALVGVWWRSIGGGRQHN